MPADEELQQYIHKYKSDLLKSKDAEKQRVFERANKIDTHLASQLILISSALVTVIGGFVTSKQNFSDNGVKAVLTSAIIFLIVSILMGLLDIFYAQDFFEKWGYHLHAQGRTIVDDTSKTYGNLVELRAKLQDDSEKMPMKGKVIPRILQIVFFLLGVIFLLVLIIAKIYS